MLYQNVNKKIWQTPIQRFGSLGSAGSKHESKYDKCIYIGSIQPDPKFTDNV